VAKLENVYRKGREIDRICHGCRNEKMIVYRKSKAGTNEDGSNCFMIWCKCEKCEAVDDFFINYMKRAQ